MESQLYLEPHLFSQLTCARCYKYMPSLAFKNASRLTYCQGGWLCRGECGLECFQPYGNANGLHCPATWDGWTCYKNTPAGTTVQKPCPAHAYFITEQPQCIKLSKKTCWENGTWFYSQEYGKEYTFYDCGSLEYHRSMTIFSIVLHSLSVVVLVPAIIIFSVYKQLQVHRIALHKNFCVAMVLYDISVILVDSVFILDHVNEEKRIYGSTRTRTCARCCTCYHATSGCASMHGCSAKAFTCIGSSHRLSPNRNHCSSFMSSVGVVPAIFVAINAALRALRNRPPLLDGQHRRDTTGLRWPPGLFCLFANFVFLCNIIRVLVTKLRSTHATEPSQFRKAVRAVLVLFPLFGMHFLMTVYRSPANCGAWEVYQYISKASDGLQGFFVAVIFCYFNGEVQGQITRSIELVKLESSLARAGDRRRSTRTQVLAC
ncbi:hypothetical protein MRX96_005751 [Rhipicephalus microplus]